MAIVKKATNTRIMTVKKDIILVRNMIINTKNKIIFDSIKDDLKFNTTKKIKTNGN